MPIRFKLRRTLAQSVRQFLRSRRGNIAALTALLIVPLAALLGMATEGGSWFLITRAMQNAADSAVIAAATNGGNATSGTDYVNEGKAIASSYGFVNGSNNATVTVPTPASYSSVTSCTSPKTCYQVKITKTVPLYLIPLVGFTGNTVLGSTRGQQLSAVALATTKIVTAPFCLTALGTGDAIVAKGVPSSNIACNIQSNGNASCAGHSLTSGWSDSVTNSNDCGSKQRTGVPAVVDPYSSLKSNYPPNSCSNYYPENHPSWPSGTNTLSGSVTLPASKVYCGDVKLGSDVTITSASPGSTIVIENGQLDLNGHTLKTATGSGATIIFTSPSPAVDQYTACSGKKCSLSVSNYPTGSGTLDISSPTSGTWSGMAIYQDPGLPLQTLTYAGNSPTWNISGIVYMPRTDFNARGAVNKSTNGKSCFTLVVNTLDIRGTGDLFYTNAQSQCAQQGVSSPTNQAYVVGALVR